MRVLQVLAGLHLGGAEQLVADLSAWLQARGHEVLVANLTAERAMLPAFESRKICVQQVSVAGIWARLYPRELIALIHRVRPDVVHCHNTAWLKTSAACRWTHTPLVFTLHNYHRDWLSNHRTRLQRAAKHTDYCVGVAPGIEKLFVEILGVPEEGTVYVRNGVPDIYSAQPAPADWKVPDGRVVGMVGRFDQHQKDQDTLVRAIALICQQMPDVHLVFIGEGPRLSEVEQLASQLGMENHVHFLGLRRDVPVLLRHLDVFVLSSRIEGESLAILEAMSAQRPIVATAVGGTPGLLANGECGLLVPPGDVQAMAQAILELLKNQTKAQELARRARERFLQEYTIDRMGERYLELYGKAIAQRKKT
ncbi:MAG: glycosyltransferase [Firmicutes bacterium]|nr:glycosyltransferase [Bacillota bacterium]